MLLRTLRSRISRWIDRHPRWARLRAWAGDRRRRLAAAFVVIAHVAGALTSVRAVMETRTAQGTIAWAVALNTFPYVSVPAYWIFGRSKFQGYVTARRGDLAQTSPTARESLEKLVNRGLLAPREGDEPALLEKLAKLPTTTGNDVELLVDGEATFASIFEGIGRARDYVLVQFYILRDDGIGRKLRDCLLERARAGVAVRVLYDEIGSHGLSDPYLGSLRDGGVGVLPFNSTRGRANRWQLNFRNHRKIVVVDGRTAWVGGLNVGDEYVGRDPKIGSWRDTHLKVTGPAALCVQVAFFEDWHWASGGDSPKLDWDPQPAPSGARQNVLCLPSGPADPLETCTLFFLHVINRAQKRIWIASPYFVPDEQIVSALQLAALRGVDVRVIVPDASDNVTVDWSGWSFVPGLERVGVRFFRHRKGFMHQKVMLVDDRHASVGTANFDNRSFRLNFEITMMVEDRGFAERVRAMLERDLADSRPGGARELEERGFWFRFATRAARLMAPVQ